MAAYCLLKSVGSTSSAVACPASVRVQAAPPSIDLTTPKGGDPGMPSLASRPNPPRDTVASKILELVGWTRMRLTEALAKVDAAIRFHVLPPSIDFIIPR